MIDELRTYVVGCDECNKQVILSALNLDGVLPLLAAMGWSAQSRQLFCAGCVAAVSERC